MVLSSLSPEGPPPVPVLLPGAVVALHSAKGVVGRALEVQCPVKLVDVARPHRGGGTRHQVVGALAAQLPAAVQPAIVVRTLYMAT